MHLNADFSQRALVRFDENDWVASPVPGLRRRMEVFVIAGAVSDGTDRLRRWDWLCLPVGSEFRATAGPEGARIWIKSGHLRNVIGCPA